MTNKTGHAKPASSTGPPQLTEDELAAAPWMKIALNELGKGVHEIRGDKSFADHFYLALSQNNPRFSLLDWNKIDHDIAEKTANTFGGTLMVPSNPDVMKYLRSTRLDTFTKRTTSKKHPDIHEWRMQAWCAAFVNWCLMQAKVNPLRSASAAAWIKFGRPVLHPGRGAIAVFKPSKAWEVQGGSGHVAFFGGVEGDKIWILGGNQNHGRVTWSRHEKENLRGYRWPEDRGDFPLKTTSSLA
jgi:uncharacterized protein (TIGR02594 family)